MPAIHATDVQVVGHQDVLESARTEAAKQWNARACGELEGTKESREYFSRVEADRYSRQPWQKDYFRFQEFAQKKVLEIGIGQGSDLLQFGRAGAECHGVDITDNHIKLTTMNFELNRIPVDIRKSDATALPFADATFDCVYSFGVIHHIPEAERVLAEVRRVLKPGGMLMLALYYKWSAFHLFSKIFANGILRGWLVTKGYDGVLATIEEGADGRKIKPYVKLYSKKEMSMLVSAFKVRDLSVHQLEAAHFSKIFKWLVPSFLIRKLDHRMGWYVTCKAER
jgi:ubiquinone/menaquinone biosynthesis C-methylase UbiE